MALRMPCRTPHIHIHARASTHTVTQIVSWGAHVLSGPRTATPPQPQTQTQKPVKHTTRYGPHAYHPPTRNATHSGQFLYISAHTCAALKPSRRTAGMAHGNDPEQIGPRLPPTSRARLLAHTPRSRCF